MSVECVAGWAGRVLASDWWLPLSRLTYCLFLVQLLPIVARAYSVRHVQDLDDFVNVKPFF